MLRILAIFALAAAASGCATFGTLTPGSNSDKGVWVSKSTGFFGIQFSDQEVLFCSTGAAPTCTKAGGDVHATKVN